MSRQFKFRVWDKVRKKMCYCEPLEFHSLCSPKKFSEDKPVYGQLISPDPEKYCTSKDQYFDGNPDNFVIQQFTWCKDGRKNDIYEGDILEYEGPHEWMRKAVVEYDDLTKMFKAMTLPDCHLPIYNILKSENSSLRIIGHIFETEASL